MTTYSDEVEALRETLLTRTDTIDQLDTELRLRWGCENTQHFIDEVVRPEARKEARKLAFTIGAYGFLSGMFTTMLVVLSGWLG